MTPKLTRATCTHRYVIYFIFQTYLLKADKTQDAACFLVSKALIRKDLVKTNLPSFMDWCLLSLKIIDGNFFLLLNNSSYNSELLTFSQINKF